MAQIDLELSLAQAPSSPAIYTTYSVTATISNTGSTTATNVRVHMPIPDGIVYTGGNEFTSSQGDFRYAGNERWIVGSLGAGNSATLTVNYFLLQNGAPAVYAQVQNASQTDSDSTPNNGTPPTPNEDDEASTNGAPPPPPQTAELRIGNLQIQDNGNQGSTVSYSFNLINGGPGVASGDYTIGAYLSTNNSLSNDDVLVGVVNTGNTPVGTINNVPGQITIPGNFPAGDYFLIVTADSNNDIAESNENNNSRSRGFTVNGDTPPPPPTGESCAFISNYNPDGFEPLNATYAYTINESTSGYSIDYSTVRRIPVRAGNYELNLNGEVLSASESTFTPPPNDVEVEVVNNDNTLRITFGNNNTSDIAITGLPSNIGDVQAGNVLQTSFGYAFGVIIIDGSNGVVDTRIYKTDSNGNLLSTSIFPSQSTFYYPANSLIEGSDGGIYAEYTAGGNYSLYGAPANGTTWIFRVASDTPSSNWVATEVSPDGRFVYTFKDDNFRLDLSKIDVNTGERLGFDITNFLNGSVQDFRFGYAGGISVNDDGSLLVGTGFATPGGGGDAGAVIGKISANGAVIWRQEILNEGLFRIGPVGTTSEGGAIFAGEDVNSFNTSDDDETIFIKLTNTGALTPLCGGTPPPPGGGDIDLSLSVNSSNPSPSIWNSFSTTYTVSNAGPQTATGVSVDIPLPNGVVYSGGNEFSASQGSYSPYSSRRWNVGSLASGASATITINLFVNSSSSITLYGQVATANEDDGDSTPGNGSCCNANEDDEAALALGASSANNRELSVDEFLETGRPILINKIFPNPSAVGVVQFEILSNDFRNADLEIYDARGKQIDISSTGLNEGINNITIDVSQYRTGLYYILIPNQNMKYMPTKFVVQND